MPKVKCKVCEHENKGYCLIKKHTVKPNKGRRCDVYIFNQAKVKEKQDVPIRREPMADVIRANENFKAQQRQYREQQLRARNSKHPLTGDLSRFTTTAAKGGDR